MENTAILNEVKAKAQIWLGEEYSKETRDQIKLLLKNDEKELIESFYRTLEFGTGGLRGIMGVGTNRMNIYTVGMATQGLANYLKGQFAGKQVKVAVAHDSRNNSRLFAETTAKIFAANGFGVYLFESLRPTPELSFAIRHFGCRSGVVITASHNPKEYNGYKAYWEDGGQVTAPHDTNIIAEVEKIKSVKEVRFEGNASQIISLGSEFDEIYTDKIKTLSLNPDIIARQKELKIVYTPIHGTGVKLVPMVLRKMGFANIINVPEQDIPDGNFPTVHSPNPEENAALQMAIDKAVATDADIVMATDPDADRVGIAVRDNSGKFAILNGNQAASILIYYLLSQWQQRGKLTGKEYIVKTIVTTELLANIAQSFGVEYFDVLTGFKYIAEKIKQLEGTKTFIGGGEESYGYLAGEFVRDKDAIIACALLAEAAAYAKDKGLTMFELLLDIYTRFGLYKEHLLSVVRKGKDGAEAIQQMMKDYRANPPKTINGCEVVAIKDYQMQKIQDVRSGNTTPIDMPKSNVLQFILSDESVISVRPSGTEPKIKFYFGVKGAMETADKFAEAMAACDGKIKGIIKDMGLE